MDALNDLTRHINTFVNFFNAVNNLFCQIRWLDVNIRNSSNLLLVLVGIILVICIYLISFKEGIGPFQSIGFPPIFDSLLSVVGPVIIVAVLLGILFYRRYALGPMQGGFENVLFGTVHTEESLRVEDAREYRHATVTPLNVINSRC